jgi:hypothetical protein
MSKNCYAPFVFCKNVRPLHDCKKDYLSWDCVEWIHKLRYHEHSIKIQEAKSNIVNDILQQDS